MRMPSPNPPRYVNNAGIARYCGVLPTAVWNWRNDFPPNHPHLPTPEPDAWEENADGDVPLWFVHRLPEWPAWRKRRAEALAEWRKTSPTRRTRSTS